MDINALTAVTNANSEASQAQSKLIGNFDTFLKLLTTQLQYQDPLEPMDSSEFTSQLVQFAGVEQSIASNQSLEQLVNFSLASATSSAAAYLGTQISAGGEFSQLADGNARWNYTIGADADKTSINIFDAGGNIVYQTSGHVTEGLHSFDWDGRDFDGGTVPDGSYRISIVATDQDGEAVPSETSVKGVVTSVEVTGDEPLLTVGGIKLRISDISTISTAEVLAEEEPEETE